uniref:Uncharacterized protein n=1 Tax=Picea sitchensis TaxID=3332 RepID=A9NSH7_PICSI|nr:unknown [Picea sitchensis]
MPYLLHAELYLDCRFSLSAYLPPAPTRPRLPREMHARTLVC